MQLQFERTFSSTTVPGLEIRVKRISLAERMRFLADNHGLMQKLKFLAAGDGTDPQERSAAADFELELSRRLFDTCLIGISETGGNGCQREDPTTWLLREAPAALCIEALSRVCDEIALSEDRRKN